MRNEAAAWVVRLAGAPSNEDRAQFEAWRQQGMDHEIAFEREMAAWERLDRLRTGISPAPSPEEAFDPPPFEEAAPVRSRRWRAIAAGITLAAGMGAVLTTSLTSAPAYATAIGQRRLVRLDDGSSVELNTDSKILVRYGSDKRSIELVRGEALFHIVSGARPFLIRASGTKLDANRADLSVRLDGADATIMVSAGTVLASNAGSTQDGRSLTALGPNTEALVDAGSLAIHPVSAEEIERSLAWLRGGISLDGRTLAEAVAEFNRYNMRQLDIGDATAGAIHVGGYFESSDVDGFVAALTKAFPVRAAAQPNGDITLSST
ncbi:FecR family protein [Sphingomonas oryzagri]|uniref:FecR domain-containing protein n=1 Tax=Sphingomonas oryzagri TaxID=3042314 RepID=A0ABT6N1U1_9SPHN|nr:FecR domain-containing protein [Sphingomonas oryzagri]MDH7639250.1 FecR domain-containing protein [Sphingomonas oryzagri]